jgi:hypothetical protein
LKHFRIFTPAQPANRALAALHWSLLIARDFDHFSITRWSLIRLLVLYPTL